MHQPNFGAAMNELYAVLMSWAVSFSGLGTPQEMPMVDRVSHAYLVGSACNGSECKVLGWFPPGHTIYVDERLDVEQDLLASSIVVHEMVHYLQFQAAGGQQPPDCEAILELERQAYLAQRRFLQMYGSIRTVGAAMHGANCRSDDDLTAQVSSPRAPLGVNSRVASSSTAAMHNIADD
jgi:hypothetical protein